MRSAIEALLAPWGGAQGERFGGLPPFDQADPVAIEAAVHEAVKSKRLEIKAIVSNASAPSFENTLEALEDSGRALKRVIAVFNVFVASMSLGEMPAVARRIAPLLSTLDDEIAHDERLFARIEAVRSNGVRVGLNAQQLRLVQVVRDRMIRQGAGQSAADKARLQMINSQLATLSTKYNQNLIDEQEQLAVFIDDVAGLEGLSDLQRSGMAADAEGRGRPGQWAVLCTRPAVWSFLINSTRRELRERVWRMWTNRGDSAGEFDNEPLLAQMLNLRGMKARLLGFSSFAHLITADRMAGTPEAALELLQRTWQDVLPITRMQITELQAIADAEGQGIDLAPWDRLHYSEKLRRARFGFESESVKPFLQLDAVLQAMFWCAGRMHGLVFKELNDVPIVHPTVRVFEVKNGEQAMGVLYFDLFNRPGKMHGSYQSEYRSAESFRGKVLPVSSINSSLPPVRTGAPMLLSWEYANVFFHEFGHALHMLCNSSAYPTLGSMGVAWDFVELPALINERWLASHEVLEKFARHYETDEPIPIALVDALERAAKFDRIFALNLDYLAPAIVDLRLHMMADGEVGRAIDSISIEQQTLAELDMPLAWDQIMRVTHNVHCFGGSYAAGLYSYLWAEVMAADAAEFFMQSPGGLFDGAAALHWMRTVLSVGTQVPAEQAYCNFRGRSPDPQALLRRFDLHPATPSLPETVK